MKKSRSLILLLCLCFAALLALWFANGMFGNPVSKVLATRSAKAYLAETYAGRDFEIEEVFFNFKDGRYHAYVKSPTSPDSSFSVWLSMTGRVRGDSYDDVTDGWNTFRRLDDAYRTLTDAVLESPDFPIPSELCFGTLEMLPDEVLLPDGPLRYGLNPRELILDHDYDIRALGQTAGHIIFYAEDEVVTFERTAQLLLSLKESFDAANAPFFAIDFVLEKPRGEGEVPSATDEAIRVSNFLYTDLYPENLAARIETAHNLLAAYYAEQDAQKQDAQKQ